MNTSKPSVCLNVNLLNPEKAYFYLDVILIHRKMMVPKRMMLMFALFALISLIVAIPITALAVNTCDLYFVSMYSSNCGTSNGPNNKICCRCCY
jgi:hypothetical protein